MLRLLNSESVGRVLYVLLLKFERFRIYIGYICGMYIFYVNRRILRLYSFERDGRELNPIFR